MDVDLGSEFDLAARLVLSAVLGALIGLEREIHDRPAGMRTHLLVSLGSASFTVLSIEAFKAPGADPARIAAQIVTGVGFLGAGAILKEGANVRGLTTAASLWAVAAVGMAAGAGAWSIAIVITIIVVVSLWPLRLVADRFVGRRQADVRFKLASADAHTLAGVVAAVAEHGATISHLATQESAAGGYTIDLEVQVRDPAAGATLTAVIGDLEGIRLLESSGLGD